LLVFRGTLVEKHCMPKLRWFKRYFKNDDDDIDSRSRSCKTNLALKSQIRRNTLSRNSRLFKSLNFFYRIDSENQFSFSSNIYRAHSHHRQPSARSLATTAATARTSQGPSHPPRKESSSGSCRMHPYPVTDSGLNGLSMDVEELCENRPEKLCHLIIQMFIRVNNYFHFNGLLKNVNIYCKTCFIKPS